MKYNTLVLSIYGNCERLSSLGTVDGGSMLTKILLRAIQLYKIYKVNGKTIRASKKTRGGKKSKRDTGRK